MDALRESLKTERGTEKKKSTALGLGPQVGSGQASLPEEGELTWHRRPGPGPSPNSTILTSIEVIADQRDLNDIRQAAAEHGLLWTVRGGRPLG
jgi:hypothetical protein